jgi:hypothetical protein
MLYNLPTESFVKYPKIIFSGLLWCQNMPQWPRALEAINLSGITALVRLYCRKLTLSAFACLKTSAYFPASLPHVYNPHAITQGQFKPY